MGIIVFILKLIAYICTGSMWNLWKKPDEDTLPEKMIYLEVADMPFTTRKAFIKEWDKLFGKSTPRIVSYIYPDLPWQAFQRGWFHINPFKGSPPDTNFESFTGEEAAEFLDQFHTSTIEGVVCSTLFEEVVTSKALVVVRDIDVTESVFRARGNAVRRDRIDSRILNGIADKKIPRKCDRCDIDFTINPPDSDGACQNCEHSLENPGGVEFLAYVWGDEAESEEIEKGKAVYT